jgi:hypothetical protein
LNYNTLDLASSSEDLITSQVLFNLGKFRSSPFAVPSQVSIPSGSATTTASVTPTISGPVGVSATTTLANSAAAPLFNATTRTRLTPNGSVGASFGDQWSQNWTMTPLEDPDQLRRLRALYQFGAGVITDRNAFACEYPLVQSQGSGGATSGQQVNVYVNGANATVNDASNKSAKTVTYDYDPEIKCVSRLLIGTPDPAFLKPPGCIICDLTVERMPRSQSGQTNLKFTGTTHKGNFTIDQITPKLDLSVVGAPIKGICIPAAAIVKAVSSDASIVISELSVCDAQANDLIITVTKKEQTTEKTHYLHVNPYLSNEWLWNLRNGPVPPQSVLLGTYAGQDLYLAPHPNSREQFGDFLLFVLEATLQSTSAAGGAASGKGGTQKPGVVSPLQTPAAPQIQLSPSTILQ